jgi:hypothetical protein
MCKYVCFHSSEFEEPGWAFFFGATVIWTNVNCEFVNILNALHQTTLTDVITRFIAFKVLITVQDFYLRSRANFKVKMAVVNDPLVIITDERKIYGPFTDDPNSTLTDDQKKFNPRTKINIKVYYFLYKAQRLFYTCFYFYFMHFLVIAVPIYRLLFFDEEA